MKSRTMVSFLAALAVCPVAKAQVERADFRIRAKLRTPDNGLWGADQSIGNARLRIQSRFLQVYYGGVSRSDDFKFRVSLDYTQISGFATEFAGSMYNTDYDVYINDAFVGRAIMGAATAGIAEFEYDSRNPNPPARPLPPDFPDPVDVFDTVRVFAASAVLPEIGDPLPMGTPMFVADLEEEFARGDVDQDGKVDDQDFAVLAANYDPFELLGAHVGPSLGDFTADNRANTDDYDILAQNWTDSADVPLEPAAALLPCSGFGGLADVGVFGGCLSGPAQSTSLGCFCGDPNHDGRIDLLDAAALQRDFVE